MQIEKRIKWKPKDTDTQPLHLQEIAVMWLADHLSTRPLLEAFNSLFLTFIYNNTVTEYHHNIQKIVKIQVNF